MVLVTDTPYYVPRVQLMESLISYRKLTDKVYKRKNDSRQIDKVSFYKQCEHMNLYVTPRGIIK